MKRAVPVFLVCTFAACDGSARQAGGACRSAIVQHLVEPQATTVKDVRVEKVPDGWEVSVEVNATRLGAPVLSHATCRVNQDFRVVAISD